MVTFFQTLIISLQDFFLCVSLCFCLSAFSSFLKNFLSCFSRKVFRIHSAFLWESLFHFHFFFFVEVFLRDPLIISSSSASLLKCICMWTRAQACLCLPWVVMLLHGLLSSTSDDKTAIFLLFSPELVKFLCFIVRFSLYC